MKRAVFARAEVPHDQTLDEPVAGEVRPEERVGALVPISWEPDIFSTGGELPADRHPVAVYLGRLSPSSRLPMRQGLEVVARFVSAGRAGARAFAWSRLRYQHTQAIRTMLAQRYAPATGNRILSALRGVLAECWRLGHMDAETFHRAIDLPAIPGTRLPRGRALTLGEIHSLFHSCAADPRIGRGKRDAAALGLMYGAGLRRSEVAALDVADYNASERTVRITGKGNRERIAFLPEGAARALDRWLQIRPPAEGPLILPLAAHRETRTAADDRAGSLLRAPPASALRWRVPFLAA